MSNVVSIVVRTINDTDDGFNKAKEGLGKSLGAMKQLVATAAPAMFGPLVAGAGASVAAFASVGAALGAFGAAVVPQFQEVTKASELYTKAQESAAAGSASAAKDMQAYKDALAKMPPATRATAVAFAGLKDDFKKWSDSLSSTTMPIFTKGLQGLRGALPLITPLVKTAAGALDDMMDSITKGMKGPGFKSFIGELDGAAKKTLPDFLKSLGNIAVGFGGIIRAFLPFSGEMTGGLEKITRKFRDFGAGLKSNAGFQQWMDGVRDKIPGILEMFGNLAKTVIGVMAALAPFSGVGLAVVSVLAAMVAAIPQGAMDFIAPMIGAIIVAVKLWAIAQGILNVVLAANPVGLVVLAIAALVAILIVAWKKSETFREIVTLAFVGTAMGVLAGVKLILQGLQFITDAFLTMVGVVLDGAAKAFGWLPELGPKIEQAAEGFDSIKKESTKAFDGAIAKVDEWNNKLLRMTVRKEVNIKARTQEAMRNLSLFQRYVNSLHGKSITITEYYRRVNAGQAPAYQHYAHGGMVGAAAGGGPRSNLTWVGENGPELADLAPGTMVHSAGDSKRMAAGTGGGSSQPIVIQLVLGTTALGEVIIDPLRKAVWTRGGDVQAVLGRR